MARRIFVTILLLATVGLAASTALASPRDEQYGNPLRNGAAQTTRTPSAQGTSTESGSGLPFTGLELGLIVAGGGAAAGAGLVLRRVGRGRRS